MDMQRRSFLRSLATLSAVGLAASRSVLGQQAIKVTPLSDGLHLLTGVGGNVAVLEGADGLLLVDSGLPETAEALTGKVKETGTGQVTRLINTHWHYDHTGGNVTLGQSGAKILAHQNVKTRLATKQYIAFLKKDVEPTASAGLPTETFQDQGSLKHGKESLAYQYLPPAHTDGDITIHFQNANVLHAGDLYFNGTYPFIDYSSGGSLAGMAADAEKLGRMVDKSTKIIPGHGAISHKAELTEYADMLAGCHDALSKEIRAGKTLEQVQAARPCAKYDEKWAKGTFKPDTWILLNYSGMAKTKAS